VKDNLSARAAEREAGTEKDQMTPSLSWAAVSFINEFNAWKTGRLGCSPVAEDGTRGLAWRDEVPADVFECASVDAATALKNYRESAIGARAGVKVGFPRFAAKHKETPRFRLRSKYSPGEQPPVRFVGTKAPFCAQPLQIGVLGGKVAREIVVRISLVGDIDQVPASSLDRL
jgi:putative transposase